ncbi:hypothetical protein [Chitinivorax sp. B]|uniref:hypothetical protein n=1 Tax=Chitinivorax sp. B TaxID=2502235 RepID=UPI0010F6F5FC|nr:hypothetical protein [Chitinivorax sp. B]
MSESKLFTIDGTIEAIHRAPGVVNLLEDMQRGALFTGTVAAATDGLANFAGSTAVALSDGEDVEHIAMLVNGKLVIGTFQSTEDLNVGDQVRLVVSPEPGDFLFTHAILRQNDGLLWMPYMQCRTKRGLVKHLMKIYLLIVIGMEIFLSAPAFLYDWKLPMEEERIAVSFVFYIILLPIMFYLSSKDLMRGAGVTENIYRALGIPKHKGFYINKFSLSYLNPGLETSHKMYVFDMHKALEAHYKKYGIRQAS